jgi:hypothetical protein
MIRGVTASGAITGPIDFRQVQSIGKNNVSHAVPGTGHPRPEPSTRPPLQ